MNAARRARKRANEIQHGGHSHADHVPGQHCPLCRTPGRTPEQRMQLQTAAAAARSEHEHRLVLAPDPGQKIFSRKAGKARSLSPAQIAGMPGVQAVRKGSRGD
jgi:hypothetical protein